MALEIERKFLIKRIPHDTLISMGANVKEIEQSFLLPSVDFPVRRIRKVVKEGKTRYFFTQKRPAGGEFSREEMESEISRNMYLELQKERDLGLNEIVKTRYVISNGKLNYEIDKFPFFDFFDVMEIELPSENALFEIPKGIEIIKEVTTDFRYTNYQLAKEIPTDF